MPDFFTPAVDLHYSDLDGAWEFPAAVNKVGPSGEKEAFLELEKTVILNSSETPQYLVRNRFEWEFEAGESKPLWLEIVYQPWSSETERGFDDPYMAVYLNQELIFKQGIDGNCCELKTEQKYLGKLSGKNTLSIFAGEMGDLQKPSGIELQSLKLLTLKRNAAQLTSAPISEHAVSDQTAPVISTIVQASSLQPFVSTERINQNQPMNREVPAENNELIAEKASQPWGFAILWTAGFITLVFILKHIQRKVR